VLAVTLRRAGRRGANSLGDRGLGSGPAHEAPGGGASRDVEPEQVGGLVGQCSVGDQAAQQRGGLLDQLAAVVGDGQQAPGELAQPPAGAGASAAAAGWCSSAVSSRRYAS
jgi:hypothetical protein